MKHAVDYADNDRRALRSWQEWEITGNERRIVLCVATNLEMRPGYPGFDPNKLSALIDEATELMRASASPVDSIRDRARDLDAGHSLEMLCGWCCAR